MSKKKRVLVVDPYIAPPWGGEGLAACVLDALQDIYDVSIACRQPPAYEALNRFFGTRLKPTNFTHYPLPEKLTRVLHRLPTPSGLLWMSVLERWAQQVARRESFDVCFSTCNECTFPSKGIQYVHFPRTDLDRPAIDYSRIHRIPGLLWIYRRLCYAIGGLTQTRIKRNITLVNSTYIAKRYAAIYGAEPQIVYPPVMGTFTVRSWEEKSNTFICLGRIGREKEVPKIIEILKRVRAQGHRFRLHIVGTWECSGPYSDRLQATLAENRDWIEHRSNLSRKTLIELLESSRYGIHGMVGEHFGMGVAEMQRAGCAVFVPTIGGPAEIVGYEDALVYTSIPDAVQKISHVLSTPAHQLRLYEHALQRRNHFTGQRFRDEIRAVVATFLNTTATG